jgi:hypothetical protein
VVKGRLTSSRSMVNGKRKSLDAGGEVEDLAKVSGIQYVAAPRIRVRERGCDCGQDVERWTGRKAVRQ